jgi:CheY-like chemotaxis protein
MTTPRYVMLIEDNPQDVELCLAAFEMSGLKDHVVVARDGAEAVAYLHPEYPSGESPSNLPAVIFLDLNLPKIDGLELIKLIRGNPITAKVPIVVFTASRVTSDAADQLGDYYYVIKPLEFASFFKTIREISSFWALVNIPAPPDAETDGASRDSSSVPSRS